MKKSKDDLIRAVDFVLIHHVDGEMKKIICHIIWKKAAGRKLPAAGSASGRRGRGVIGSARFRG